MINFLLSIDSSSTHVFLVWGQSSVVGNCWVYQYRLWNPFFFPFFFLMDSSVMVHERRYVYY